MSMAAAITLSDAWTAGRLALRDVLSPPLDRQLGRTAISSAIVIGVLWVGSAILLSNTTVADLPWVEWAIDLFGWEVAVMLSLALFPPFATVIAGFHLERAADLIESTHYATVGPHRDETRAEVLGATLRFAGLSLLLNLLALPIYVLLPVINLVVFYALNGYLLGRDYFALVAMRHWPKRQANLVARQWRSGLFRAGVLIAVAMSVPIVNLVAPLWAMGLMVHLVAGRRETAG
jgi:uncharacterized protein involved in cysteine biosynthesis